MLLGFLVFPPVAARLVVVFGLFPLLNITHLAERIDRAYGVVIVGGSGAGSSPRRRLGATRSSSATAVSACELPAGGAVCLTRSPPRSSRLIAPEESRWSG